MSPERARWFILVGMLGFDLISLIEALCAPKKLKGWLHFLLGMCITIGLLMYYREFFFGTGALP
jgi:hypothetical protein